MFTDDEKNEIRARIQEYPTPPAACIEALKTVQKQRRWVSDEAVRELAGILGMTVEEVDNVATFYNLIYRRPVGRHVILLCDSVSCWILGQPRLEDHLAGRLGIAPGETTPDGRFTLLPMACLGCCDRAPAMIVDEDLHTHLDEASIDEILSGYE